jgi:hypothetical protein
MNSSTLLHKQGTSAGYRMGHTQHPLPSVLSSGLQWSHIPSDVETELKRVLPVTALDMAHVIRYTRLPQRIHTCCFCD